ncbi:MAG: malto-oligosyltrehalose trehalohydrolase [Candidatus Sumerlaeia bacterium]
MREVYAGLGACCLGTGTCRFTVWAPGAHTVDVHLVSPDDRTVAMQPAGDGYFHADAAEVPVGALYYYRLDGGEDRPDPASRSQPRGVHGPSEVINQAFPWTDAGWAGPALKDYVIYELHVGTYTPEGTFEALIPHLGELRELGITAVELLPVAETPGKRNWGYDGVDLWAPHSGYGGPHGLKRLVDACHAHGMAAVLDVVYNHLGPEGNYLAQFGPYFTDAYRTPWGPAINYDGPGSDGVRRFVVGNALYWIDQYHFDALRLDALHAVFDRSACHIFAELADSVHAMAETLGRRVYLIAETSLNDTRLVRPAELGGHGLDAQWNDDFHHAVHALMTGERDGYYADFGRVHDLVQALREGYVYSGQYSPYRGRRHGHSSRDVPARRFVICTENHDQVGNRFRGDRHSTYVSREELRLAAGVMILAPYVPLLFMGEEWGEPAPFLYFVSHGDPALAQAVRKGRAEEFAGFKWAGEIPDPQSEETFRKSKVDHTLKAGGWHGRLRDYYRRLLKLRRDIPALSTLDKEKLEVVGYESSRTVAMRRWAGGSEVLVAANFGREPARIRAGMPPGPWRLILDSADEAWGGSGAKTAEHIDSRGDAEIEIAPLTLLVYEKERQHETG